MSADDFHTKYTSVMESMLRSAIAETTKLFETMVNDLKAEISQMRKENEDLKTRCVQYEKGRPAAEPADGNRVPEQSDVSGKCDTAVQCDLAPFRTVLVEECQPLVASALQNQDQQHLSEQMGYSLQEHDYIRQDNSDSKTKSCCDFSAQSVLKQEEMEPSVSYRQVLSDNAGSAKSSENVGPYTVQKSSAEGLKSPQNQLWDVKPSLVISLKDAFSDDVKEEPEDVQMTTKTETHGEVRTVSQKCHDNGAARVNEQTETTVQQHTEELEQTAMVNKGVCERLNKGSAKESFKPKTLVRCKRGRPPKKRKVKSFAEVIRNDASSVTENDRSSMIIKEDKTSTETSSVITPSVQENANTSLKGKMPDSGEFLGNCFSKEVEEEAAEPQSIARSSASGAPSTAQAASGPLKRCHTSVSLQDAMLLVEAMNQSTVESTVSPPLSVAQPQAHLSSLVGASETLNKASVAPQICSPPVKTAAPPVKQTTALTKTPSAALAAVITTKTQKKGSQTIIILPRPGTSFSTPKITVKSPILSSTATENDNLPPKSPPVSKTVKGTDRKFVSLLPSQSKTMSTDQQSQTPQKQRITIIIPPPASVGEPMKLEHVNLSEKQDATKSDVAADPHPTPDSDTDSAPDLDLILDTEDDSAPESDLAPDADPTHVPEADPAPAPNTDPDLYYTATTGSSTRQISMSNPSLLDEIVLSEEINDLAHNLDDSKQATPFFEMVNAPTDTSLSSKVPVWQVPTPASPVLPPATKQKLCAVVRLTRLPFPVSTKESVLVSRLSEGNGKRKPSEPPVLEMPILSLLETPKNPQVSSSTTTVVEETSACEYRQASTTSAMSKSRLAESTEVTNVMEPLPVSDMAGELTQASITHKNNSDPHLKMTKTQFLAQLLVSPVDRIKESSTKDHTDAGETRNCDRKSLPKTSIVARLRSHLKSHLEARTTAKKSKAQTNTDAKSPKKSRVENDHLNHENETKKPVLSIEPDVTSKMTPSNIIANTPSSTSLPSGLCGDGATAALSVGIATSVRSGRTTTCDLATVKVKRSSSGRDDVDSLMLTHDVNNKFTSVSPRRSKSKKKRKRTTISTSASPRRETSDRDVANSVNERSPSVSPRRSKYTQESARCEITNNSSSIESRKSCSVRTKLSIGEDAGPKITASLSVCLRKSILGGNVKDPEMFSCPSNSTVSEVSLSTKPIKIPPSSFSLEWYPITTISGLTGKNKGEDKSSSVKCPDMAEKSTAAETSRLTEGHSEPEANLNIVNATKLAKTAKAKKRKGRAKMKTCYRSKAEKSELAENQGNTGIVKKCRAQVWYPPTLPPNEVPSTERRKPEPIKIVDNVPLIPFNQTPIVSPLQPLAVIGKFLLRNQCGECGRILGSSAALESHVSLHKARRPFSCPLCGKCFPDSKSFKRHNRVHRNGRIHICPKCGKGFVYRFGLSKHVQMVHGRIKPFICQICSKGFYTKRDVEVHIRVHTGEKPFHCHLCEKKFTRRVELNVHLRWHNGEKRHWCPYCGKGFLDSNNLKRHKYTHTGEKPYSCPHCPKRFTQTGHLKKHMRNVHDD